MTAIFFYGSLSYAIGATNHGLVAIYSDEIVFEYGKTIKIGDNLKDAMEVLEVNQFSCKELSIKPKHILSCSSYMEGGFYGGQQIVIQLTIENGKVTSFE